MINIKKQLFIVACLFILSACAGLFINPVAKDEFEAGFTLFNQGKYEDAVLRFQKAIEIEPEYTKAYIYLGRSYLNLGQWFEAIPPLRTAYRLSPKETKKEIVNFLLDALIGGALAEFQKGNFQNSVDLLKEALSVEPESAKAEKELIKSLIACGGELLSEGKASEAISQFSEAVKLAPENLDAYLGLAKAFLKNGDFFDALQVIKEAIKIAPTEEKRSVFRDLLRK